MRYLSALLLLPGLAYAGTVFDGYDAYYATLPGRMFTGAGTALQPYSVVGDDSVRYGWQGTTPSGKHKVEIRRGILSIDGQAIRSKSITVFPNETVDAGDLGNGTMAYFSPGWACVENTPASASGTAVRHKAVYLVWLTRPKVQAWKLPSLFAACADVRQLDGQVRFDQVEYRYKDGQDDPAGVVFNEFILLAGQFASTGHKREASFVEQDNVYKITF